MGVPVDALLAGAGAHHRRTGRPFVTLSYAQSLDGSLSAEPGAPLAISGSEALIMTHQLRAAHSAILVGIGTVLADNPQLTTRKIPGDNPQRIVLDTNLRLPPDTHLVKSGPPAWIFCSDHTPHDKIEHLEKLGTEVYALPLGEDGLLDLETLLEVLGRKRVISLMVEGGRRVITNFLATGLADLAVVTIAPLFVGGQPSVDELREPFPRLVDPRFTQAGDDLIVYGALKN